MLAESGTLGVRVSTVRRWELERALAHRAGVGAAGAREDRQPERARAAAWRPSTTTARRWRRRTGGACTGGLERGPGARREELGVSALTLEAADRLALGSAIVAFSGGVDSSLVAALAARALGDRALAITAVSPALADGRARRRARGGARRRASRTRRSRTDELASEDYRAQRPLPLLPLQDRAVRRARGGSPRERGYAAVLSGANADDAGDWRPGLRAAADHGVLHPLLEAGAGKAEVRALAERARRAQRAQAGEPLPGLADPLRHAGRARHAAGGSTPPSGP